MNTANHDLKEKLLPSESKIFSLQVPSNSSSVVSSESTTWRLISFGLSSAVIATHTIGNGLILSSLGETGEAASALIITTLLVINGAAIGVLINTGIELGKALGREEKKDDSIRKVSSIIKSSWAIGGILGLGATFLFLSTRGWIPLLGNAAIGKAAGDFFLTYSIGAFSELMITTNGMIIAQVDKNMIVPLLSVAAFRLPALGLEYLFGKKLGLGTLGVGLGYGLPALISFLITQRWFSKRSYQQYNLYSWPIENFPKYKRSFCIEGSKLALQRLSEWGNLATIVYLFNSWHNSDYSLKTIQPALQANTLIALTAQGVAQAAMMFISRDLSKQKEYYKKFQKTFYLSELENFKEKIAVNKKTFIMNNLAGLALTTVMVGGVYFSRKQFIDFFLDSEDDDQYNLAESCLYRILITTFFDTLRIDSGGILRGLGDILIPTLANIIFMTLIGVTIGGIISHENNEDPLPIFNIRIVMIFLSALFNFWRFYSHMNQDTLLYQQGKLAPNIYAAINAWEQVLDLEPLNSPESNTILTRYHLEIDEQATGFFSILANQAPITDEMDTNDKTFTPDSIKRLLCLRLAAITSTLEDGETIIFERNMEALQQFCRILTDKLNCNIVLISVETNQTNYFRSSANIDHTIILAHKNYHIFYQVNGQPTPGFISLAKHSRRIPTQSPAQLLTQSSSSIVSLPTSSSIQHVIPFEATPLHGLLK